jgi:hypothetical protein
MPQIRLADRAKRRPRRLAKQIGYSEANRQKLRELKRPNRDRVAKACLTVILERFSKTTSPPLENGLIGDVVVALIKEGFDAEQCKEKVTALVSEARATTNRSRPA